MGGGGGGGGGVDVHVYEIRLDISCASSARQLIHMKCQTFLILKYKTNNNNIHCITKCFLLLL